MPKHNKFRKLIEGVRMASKQQDISKAKTKETYLRQRDDEIIDALQAKFGINATHKILTAS